MTLIAKRYAFFSKEEISQETFDRELAMEGFKAGDEIRNEGRVWSCESCKEENPLNFDSCWKCSGLSPVSSPLRASSPQLPDLGGGHAWDKPF